MLKCHGNACVCALILACKILSMSSWPLLIEARIPNLGQFKEVYSLRVMTECLIRQSLIYILRSPVPHAGHYHHG
ncbi:hypothetical protein AB3S75_030898 [Citrus x aurantiifolia]